MFRHGAKTKVFDPERGRAIAASCYCVTGRASIGTIDRKAVIYPEKDVDQSKRRNRRSCERRSWICLCLCAYRIEVRHAATLAQRYCVTLGCFNWPLTRGAVHIGCQATVAGWRA